MTYDVNKLPTILPVGVQTETDVKSIDFDVSTWLAQWPDMQLSIWPTRPGETQAYPANQVNVKDGILSWYPDEFDTERYGTGKVEIFGYTPDGKRKLTGDKCSTQIRRTTLANTKTPGESENPWVASVLEAAERAEEAAKTAEEALKFGTEYGVTLVQAPMYVDNVNKMTDPNRIYVLADTGHIWAYMDTTQEEEITVTDEIVGTADNPYEVGRLSSSGALSSDVATHVLTPYIDLTKPEYAGKTIELHLDGIRYVSQTQETYLQMALYKADKSVLSGRTSTCLDASAAILPVLTNVAAKINGTTSATLTITIPASYNGTEIGYMRFCGLGTEAASHVYITYSDTKTASGGRWVDTGVTYASTLTEKDKQTMVDEVASMVDSQLLAVIGDGVVTI